MWQSQLWIPSLMVLFLTTSLHALRVPWRSDEKSVKTSSFLSPPFFLRPGSVVNKNLYGVPFPKGHVAVKSFHAEVVDEMGVSVPLHETYLHHWTVERFYAKRGNQSDDMSTWQLDLVRNAGVCRNNLGQYFGLGSETRRTSTWIPGPYGIEIGNPNSIPDGYEEIWMLNIHAIDTRGVEDRSGCIECKCSVYNLTDDWARRFRAHEYKGGLLCCTEQTRCRLREGGVSEDGGLRKLYMKYTVKWVEWDESINPVRIYLLDVTGTGKEDLALGELPSCKVEYDVEHCDSVEKANNKCIVTKRTRVVIPRGGDLIYINAHQHAGGIGGALYGEDGRVLCASFPTYGEGEEAGNESGYIVGMSSCTPKPGTVRIRDGEVLTAESNYSSTQSHTGVMGLIYFLVADPQPKSEFLDVFHGLPVSWGRRVEEYRWAFIPVGVIAVVAFIVGISYRRRYVGEGYQSI